jgi:hypothetical protein
MARVIMRGGTESVNHLAGLTTAPSIAYRAPARIRFFLKFASGSAGSGVFVIESFERRGSTRRQPHDFHGRSPGNRWDHQFERERYGCSP